jgi:predicted transcriptional regulator
MAAETKIDSAEMLRMLGEGQSQAAIARHFNVSRQAVSRRLKKLGGRTKFNPSDPIGRDEELVDKVVCEFCEMESPKDDFDEDGMCRLCRWAYGKGEYATKC